MSSTAIKYSIIIPVYNRPEEVEELLSTLAQQSFTDFEVLVIEDGSADPCFASIDRYKDSLKVQYFEKPNSGPADSRNVGFEKSKGQWLIFLDSDTLVPKGYLQHIDDYLTNNQIDFFGGPDKDHIDFSAIQKAINYSMTSFLTTGGIRGSRNSIEKFKPRSFNMGVKASAFESVGGFDRMRYGEDIDLSIRLEKKSYHSSLIPEAFVFHKRRTSLLQFFRQIHHSGVARIVLTKKHEGSLRVVHFFPLTFLIGFFVSLIFSIILPSIGSVGLGIYGCYLVIIFLDSSFYSRNLKVGILSPIASFIQLSSYALGFIKGIFTVK